jgi:replicative DNA helicase
VPRDLRSLIHEAIQRVEKAYSRPVHERVALTGVTTGLASLDELTRGYQGSELFIIGGRPSMGKTAFVLNSILAAAEKGHPVLKFSLEMVDRENADRILSLDSGVPGSWLKTGMLNTRDWVNITKSSARLSALNVKIDDDATQGIESICSKARKWRRDPKVFKTGNELGLIVLDYLQLVHVDSTSRSNREQDVTKIGRALKALSKELNVALVALASLSRQCEARTDKRPVMSDLRESGNLESDADSVLMLYRDEVYNAEAEKGLAELIMRKGRNSGVGTVMARWDAATMKFADIEGTK